jgi:glycogen operon protein
MLLGGDELGRTQKGNNNAYCQDNELSWVNWSAIDETLVTFTRWLIAFRRQHPVFRRRRFFQGLPIRGTVDIGWFKPDGDSMTDADWEAWHARTLGVFLNGNAIAGRDEHGRRIMDDSFLLLFNAHSDAVDWIIPRDYGRVWTMVLDTSRPQPETERKLAHPRITSNARSVIVLQHRERRFPWQRRDLRHR